MTFRALGFNGSEMARMPVSWPSMETRIPVWAKHRHRHPVVRLPLSPATQLLSPSGDFSGLISLLPLRFGVAAVVYLIGLMLHQVDQAIQT
ncbi:hypothetical protein L2E82_30960 [Cichorium intybus]|uniref:Uncharacterized protein n=1 Tax=Cichorium intybus TaxID=13427 RepID=A0ACB9D278_CICIN|nr:hypothetical protein L2E82_30960 [Cichorium intybus]